MTDEAQELLEQLPAGGLLQFVKSKPSTYKVAKDPTTSLNVVSLQPCLSSSPEGPCVVPPALLDEIASIIEAQPFSDRQGVPVARVYSNLSASSRMLLKPHKSLIHLLQQFKDRFELSGGNAQVKLLRTAAGLSSLGTLDGQRQDGDGGDPLYLPDAPRSGLSCFSAADANLQLQSQNPADPIRLKLAEVLPFDYFVPLSLLVSSSSPFLRLLEPLRQIDPNATPCELLLRKLQQLPEGFAEVRVFDESREDQIFIRMIGRDLEPDVMSERGDMSLASRYGGLIELGFAMLDHLEEQGVDEFNVGDVPAIFPEEIVNRIPLKGYPAILVFERLPHFFVVNAQEYTVRARGKGRGGGDDDTMHEYSMTTTPLLRALRHVRSILQRPMSVGLLAAALQPDIAQQINQVFGSLVGFIEAHPVHYFIKDDEVYGTHHSTAAIQGHKALSEDELARAIFDMLPVDEPVIWASFILSRKQQFPQLSTVAREFFDHYTMFFAVYEGLFLNGFLVTRRGSPTPPYVHPPCLSILDALRQIAIASVGGADEGLISNFLTRDARSMVKAFGGLEGLVRQLPQWFDVKNERRQVGQSFVAYIGHLPKN